MATTGPRPFKEAWEWFLSLFKKPQTPPPPPPSETGKQHNQAPKATGSPEQRYQVQDANGQTIGQSESLKEAHQQWKDRTGSQGRIIDTETGDDVTPPPDDDGRFVVLDENGQQLASFDKLEAAEEYWRDATNGKGKIIDTLKGSDVTPGRRSTLTSEQRRQIVEAAGKEPNPDANPLEVDAKQVADFLRQIVKLPVPIFDLGNIAGKAKLPTKTMHIKRQRVVIDKVKEIVVVDVPGPPQPGEQQEVPYPTDSPELVRIRRIRDLPRVARQQLGLPDAVLKRRLVRRELVMRVYEEETEGPPTVTQRRVYQEVERPRVEEYLQEVEVVEEPEAQLLEIVVDVSGSMLGVRINMAIAMALAVIGAHMDDGSRYIYRPFASFVGNPTRANSNREKRKLAKKLMNIDEALGGGTMIISAVQTAAGDVRAIAGSGDRPEILLITDGSDSITSAELYAALGNDVILHTVVVDSSNQSLKVRSATYYELLALPQDSSDYRIQGK